MSITFKHTVIHVLDLSMGMPLLSTDLLVLNDETESFITRHLIKIFESSSSCEAIFKENAYLPSRLQGPLTEDIFMELTSEITNTFYRYMTEYENDYRKYDSCKWNHLINHLSQNVYSHSNTTGS